MHMCDFGTRRVLKNMCLYVCVCVLSLQAYGVGGMRKRQEPPAIEDRDKPYVCDSEREQQQSTFILLFLSVS